MRLLRMRNMADAEVGAELALDVSRMSISRLVYVDGAAASNTRSVNHKTLHYGPSLRRLFGTGAMLESAVQDVSDLSHPSD